MPTITIDDACVHYQVTGSGPGLVLVSGTGGNLHSNWDHVLPQLSAHRQVLQVDYAGSGQTTDPQTHLTVERLARQVLAAADAAGLRQFDLLGYSLGSCIAMWIAAQHPERVRALVLVAGFSDGTDARNALQMGLWLDLIAHDPRLFARTIVLNGMSPQRVASMGEADIQAWVEAICQHNDWHGIARQIDLDRRVNVTSMLRDILAPTLVIGCLYDQVIPMAQTQAVAEAIPEARWATLAAGHLAPFEQPQPLVKMVLQFLSEVAPSAGLGVGA